MLFFFLILRKYSFVSRFVRKDLKASTFYIQLSGSTPRICKQYGPGFTFANNSHSESKQSMSFWEKTDFERVSSRSTEKEDLKFWGRVASTEGKLIRGNHRFQKGITRSDAEFINELLEC